MSRAPSSPASHPVSGSWRRWFPYAGAPVRFVVHGQARPVLLTLERNQSRHGVCLRPLRNIWRVYSNYTYNTPYTTHNNDPSSQCRAARPFRSQHSARRRRMRAYRCFPYVGERHGCPGTSLVWCRRSPRATESAEAPQGRMHRRSNGRGLLRYHTRRTLMRRHALLALCFVLSLAALAPGHRVRNSERRAFRRSIPRRAGRCPRSGM